jgi:hypothetical protein
MHFVFKIIIIINDIATKFWYTLKKFNLIIEMNIYNNKTQLSRCPIP